MVSIFFGIFLLLISLGAIDVLKTYHKISRKQLKDRARNKDLVAEKLYQVASYQESLDLVMYIIIAFSFSLGFLLLSTILPSWLSFFSLVVLILIAFVWLPVIQPTRISSKVGIYLTSPLAQALSILHPYLQNIIKFVKFEVLREQKIYDQNDLQEFLENLIEDDNNINKTEIKYLLNSAKAINLSIDKIYTPWKKLKFLYQEEAIGPIVLDEFHKRQQKIIPVLDDRKNKELVGLINIERIDINKSLNTKSAMDKTIFYLDEKSTSIDALISFGETNYPVFIVVDEQQTYKGLLALDNLIKILIEDIKVAEE